MGCTLQIFCEQKVFIANSNKILCSTYKKKILCSSNCKCFEWMMHGTHSSAYVLVIPIKRCELTLGMEWFKSLGVVKGDFQKKNTEFSWKERVVVLQAEETRWTQVKEDKDSHEKNRMRLFIIWVERIQHKALKVKGDELIPKENITLLGKFQNLFEESTVWPTYREHDLWKQAIQHIEAGEDSTLTWKRGLLLKIWKWAMGTNSSQQRGIIHTFPLSSATLHSGAQVTTKRIVGLCNRKGLERDVRRFLRKCDTCQHCKHDQSAYLGYLQPLPIPSAVST